MTEDLKLSKKAQAHVDNLKSTIAQITADLQNAKSELERIEGRNGELEKQADLNQLLADIANVAKKSFSAAIEKELSGYNSPLNKIANAAIAKHESEIRPVFDSAIASIVTDKSFKDDLTAALRHKLARVMVAKLEGEAEKRFNDWRSDAEKRAQLTLGIAKLIEELK